MAVDEFSIPEHVLKVLKNMGYTPDTSMSTHIQTWWNWYTRNSKFYDVEYADTRGRKKKRKRLSTKPAKKVSKEWASLTMNEDTIISVEKKRANVWLKEFLERNNFWPTGQMVVEKAFALGTAAWALWFDVISDDKTEIKIRRYDARMIIPLSWDEEGITECAFVTRTSIKGKRADQLQIHCLNGDTYHIITKLWIEQKEVTDDSIIDDFDTGCNSKTFSIIKPAEENTVVDLSPFGMSIFEDATDAIQAVDLSYDSIFHEVKMTAVKVFMDDQMFDITAEDGKITSINPGEDGLYRKIYNDDQDQIDIFSPNIRIEPLKEALNIALAQLGTATGFGENYFTLDKNGGLKTATEVSSDNSALMRNIRKHENVLRGAIQDIITALLTCARIHCNAPIEEDFGAVQVEFDDSIIVDTQAEKTLMLSEINAGVVPAWKYAETFYGMSEEEAKAALPQTVYEEGM